MGKASINVYVDLNRDEPTYVVENRHGGEWKETARCYSEDALIIGFEREARFTTGITEYDLFSLDHRTSIPLANISKNKP
ncbi:MAG: hypothetical protein AABW88_01755, partial [Nanoarchaeota archaeon]